VCVCVCVCVLLADTAVTLLIFLPYCDPLSAAIQSTPRTVFCYLQLVYKFMGNIPFEARNRPETRQSHSENREKHRICQTS